MRPFLFALLLATPLLSRAHQQPAVPAQSAAPLAHAAGAPTAAKAPVAAIYRAAAPEQRAERLGQQTGKQPGLDAATTAKVTAAALVRAQKTEAIQTSTASNKEKNTALLTNAQAFEAALKDVLTPTQFAPDPAHGAKAPTE